MDNCFNRLMKNFGIVNYIFYFLIFRRKNIMLERVGGCYYIGVVLSR